MALTIDTSTPVFVATAASSVATASFTPPVGSLLVVAVTSTSFAGSPNFNVTSTSLTFTSRILANVAGETTVELFTCEVGANGGSARTVSVSTAGFASIGLKVWVVTGQHATSYFDTANSGSSTSNVINATITTGQNGCWVFGAGSEFQSLGVPTSTDVGEGYDDLDMSYLAVRKPGETVKAGPELLNFDAAGTAAPAWGWAAISIRPAAYTLPAIYKVADRGQTSNTTTSTSTTVDMAAAGSIATGNYLIARGALDNSGTNGAAPSFTVTDPRSNTWTVTTGANADPGAANAGATNYIAYAKVTNAYTNGDDLTFNHSPTTPAKAIVVEEWFGIAATTPVAVAEATATGATAAVSISRTPTAAGQLFYGAIAAEGPATDAFTQDSDTTDGPWTTLTRVASANATAASNQDVYGVAKLVTGTTAQTWNPNIGTARDWAAVALVFATGTNSVPGAAAANFGFTGTASGVPTTNGTVAGSFGFTATTAGVDRAVGVAVASFGFTAVASGTVGTPPVTGHAESQLGFTAAASGNPRTSGTAAVAFGFTATATGTDRALGAAVVAFGFTGTSAGVDRAVGAALGALGFTATASGTPGVHGAAVAAFGFTGAGQGSVGSPPVTGTATALFGFTATTQGLPRAVGAAAGSFGFTATATGRCRVLAAAVLAFGFTASTTGKRSVFGAAPALLGFTASILGAVIEPVTYGTASGGVGDVPAAHPNAGLAPHAAATTTFGPSASGATTGVPSSTGA